MNLFNLGLIPGPNESEDAFEQRVQEATPQAIISVFGLNPNWIPLIYSNRSLAPWEGGCAWILDGKVVLQLRKRLEKRETYLGIVSKKELLEHEAVHAIRVAFEEPRFEEVLAYQTAKSRYRRFFGPFFRSPRESVLFLSCILLFPLTLLFPFLQLPFAGLMTVITGYGFLRLMWTQRTFKAAKNNLAQLTKNPLALMLYLTDREIERFAKSNLEQILDFIVHERGLRFEHIQSAILEHC